MFPHATCVCVRLAMPVPVMAPGHAIAVRKCCGFGAFGVDLVGQSPEDSPLASALGPAAWSTPGNWDHFLIFLRMCKI